MAKPLKAVDPGGVGEGAIFLRPWYPAAGLTPRSSPRVEIVQCKDRFRQAYQLQSAKSAQEQAVSYVCVFTGNKQR